MTDTRIPVAGSLSAKVIRACRAHNNKCPLTCPQRKVLDVGTIASFDARPRPTLLKPNEGIGTGKTSEPSLLDRFGIWLDAHFPKSGGQHG
jgi:hypothetical protein